MEHNVQSELHQSNVRYISTIVFDRKDCHMMLSATC